MSDNMETEHKNIFLAILWVWAQKLPFFDNYILEIILFTLKVKTI